MSDQLVNVTNAVVCLICASGTNQVTDPTNTAVTTFNNGTATSMVGLVASKDGWYIAMPAGERSVSSPTLIGGTVFFPSFLPTNDVCASTGTSYLYALFYKTGTSLRLRSSGQLPQLPGRPIFSIRSRSVTVSVTDVDADRSGG